MRCSYTKQHCVPNRNCRVQSCFVYLFFLLLYVCAPFKLCLLPPFFFFNSRILSVLLFFSIRTKYKNIFTPTNCFELVTRLLVFCMLYLNYGADLEAMIHLAHRSNSFETTCQALNKAKLMAEFDRYFIVFFSRYGSCDVVRRLSNWGFFWIFMCFKSLPSVSSQRVPFENYAYREYTLSVFRSRNQLEKNNTKPYTLL